MHAFVYLMNHPIEFYTGDGLVIVALLAWLAHSLRTGHDGDDQ